MMTRTDRAILAIAQALFSVAIVAAVLVIFAACCSSSSSPHYSPTYYAPAIVVAGCTARRPAWIVRPAYTLQSRRNSTTPSRSSRDSSHAAQRAQAAIDAIVAIEES